jgi:hypothetical protein
MQDKEVSRQNVRNRYKKKTCHLRKTKFHFQNGEGKSLSDLNVDPWLEFCTERWFISTGYFPLVQKHDERTHKGKSFG